MACLYSCTSYGMCFTIVTVCHGYGLLHKAELVLGWAVAGYLVFSVRVTLSYARYTGRL